MSESAAALCAALWTVGGVPPCDQALSGRAAKATTPNPTNERDEVARVSTAELKRRIGLSIETSRNQDFVYSSLDVIQSETDWSELNCWDVTQIGEQQPGLRECCTGRGDLSRQELVGQTVYRQFRLGSQSRLRHALGKNVSGVMKFGSQHC
jgi:hypothetical protein